MRSRVHHPRVIRIDPYHSMSKQKIFPVEPLIQCEAGRAKTMQRQSLYSPRTPKWPPSDKGELHKLENLPHSNPLGIQHFVPGISLSLNVNATL